MWFAYLTQQCRNFLGVQMLRLTAFLVKDVDFHKYELGQTNSDIFATKPTRFVFVQRKDHLAVPVGVLTN